MTLRRSRSKEAIRFRRTAKPITLPAVRPNVGLELQFRRRLEKLVDEMSKSTDFWLKAAYRVNPPEMAADESPAMALREAVRRLALRWQKRFDAAAPELARYFATAARERSDKALQSILKRAGFAVEFKLTRSVNDVVQAQIGEQVALIKSISSQYFTQIEGLVMRAVQEGRPLGALADDLSKRYEITHRRAALIARDQVNKSTAVITRTRQQEIGVTQAQWVHSHGGHQPRPTHVKAGADKVRYDVAEGWYDPAVGYRIWPGVLISCRCVSRGIISGVGLQ